MNRTKQTVLTLLLIGVTAMLAPAQQKKKITLEHIWVSRTFGERTVEGVNWMKNGQFYTSQVHDARGNGFVVKYNIQTGKATDTLVRSPKLKPAGATTALDFDSYTFSEDEKKLLLTTNTTPIYRRSFVAEYYVYNLQTQKLQALTAKQPVSYATFSPDGKKVAFVRDNNLFYVDLATMQEVQITTTGEKNKIINGSTDWVYEEEFEFVQAFFWSPDSRKLAYYTFDESQVPEYNMQLWGGLYPEDYKFKYPKAGEKNSEVSIAVYHLDQKKTQAMDIGPEKDQYIPRIKWTQNPDLLAIMRMNRLQNHLTLLHANAQSGVTQTVYTETSQTYIEINDDLTYLQNGKQFVISNETQGYKHLFLYNMDGKLIRPITTGNWEVADFNGIDEKSGMLYYTSTETSPHERQLYRIRIDAKGKQRLTAQAGTYNIKTSPDFKVYLAYHTTINAPTTVSLHQSDGKLIKVLEQNEKLKKVMANFEIAPAEFMDVKLSDELTLNAWMIKPTNFDKNKRYPVLMYVYGGPGHQTVADAWMGANYFWFQMLAQKGYVVVSVDGRGTGGRGAAFKKATYAQLGKLETQDAIATAQYLGRLPYVDASRIGIWGWSFGGYLSSLCMTLGADYFKTGIAVAPVTNWRFYDSIYTERFLGLPQDNPYGYDDNSPTSHADRLKGNYLLIHGTADDNVHLQNSIAMQDALVAVNKQFSSFIYPNRNHGIYGGMTRIHLYQMMTDYLLKNL